MNGRPQTCQTGPTGCFIWRDEPVCGTDQQCVTGQCRTVCTSGEVETCPAGTVCTGITEGRFCLPGDADAGVVDAGSGGGSAVDAGAGGGGGSSSSNSGEETIPGGNGRVGAVAMGCHCNAVDAGLLPLLALGMMLRRRRAGR